MIETLRSDFITQGPKVPKFEQAVAKKVKAEHAVAVNSATSALHLACRALEVGPGDLVWTSPITFVASANCVRYCGADVDFVDIDPHTYNMSISALKAKLEQAEYAGKLPKVVIPVHMCGQSCGMAAIHALSQKYGFAIIEDASHAIGGSYKNEPVGCCRYSDITVFSFHPVKIITTAEGGMALTNRDDLAERMALLRSHGITREFSRERGAGSVEQRAQSLERGAWSVEHGERSVGRMAQDIEQDFPGASSCSQLPAPGSRLAAPRSPLPANRSPLPAPALLLRTDRPGLQLPHDRAPGCPGPEPTGAAGRIRE